MCHLVMANGKKNIYISGSKPRGIETGSKPNTPVMFDTILGSRSEEKTANSVFRNSCITS